MRSESFISVISLHRDVNQHMLEQNINYSEIDLLYFEQSCAIPCIHQELRISGSNLNVDACENHILLIDFSGMRTKPGNP